MSNEHKKCLISGVDDLRHMKGYESNYLIRSYPTGFVFCSKIPSDAELSSYYGRYNRTDEISAVTIKSYHTLLDGFEKYRQSGRILDIGCGTGLFLKEAKKRGWAVFGTEFTPQAIMKCVEKGIDTRSGRLQTEWWPEGYFDIITSFEVIEHINNPLEETRIVYRFLRGGGLFYVTTPNFNSLERYVIGPKHNSIITYPEHLCYYSRKTLTYLMLVIGFKKEKVLTTSISVTNFKNWIKNSNEPYQGPSSVDEQVRVAIDSSRIAKVAKTIVNYFLNLIGLGNSLKGWFVKPSR
jgi:2-polyprenyl-3-methyl-5-hydroxy-6-metoxy-1,4-benzoquinol methylase